MENVEEKQVKVGVFACTSCGADLKYKPGSQKLKCDFCGAENEIPTISQPIEELDFQAYLANQSSKEDTVKETYAKCESCGASSTLLPNVSSSLCPYCSTPLVVANAQSESIIQPKLLIPFKLNKNEAQGEFKKWVAKLWFAPDYLKKASLSLDQFKGIYIPYWTFDTVTQSSYIGQRGENYYVTEPYTVTENGQTVSKTREVQKTRWFPASGIVNRNFDDILVAATKSLPQDKLNQLEPWDLVNLVPYDINFLSGFVTEKYQIDLAEGFEIVKGIAEDQIQADVTRDIGGDKQKVIQIDTNWSSITFKHILLPVFVSAYRFDNKLYNFIVNARTGEVQGDRPWSWMKIAGFIIIIAVIIGAIIYFTNKG